VEFQVLGPLALIDDGRLIALTSPHQRRLLAALLLEVGRSVSVGMLVDALWGEDPPASATVTVQSYVSRLRHRLGRGVLKRSPGGYVLSVAPDTVDAVRFARLAAEARSAADPGERVHLLEQALALWHGDAFTDVAHYPPGQAEAARLAELRVSCQEERGSALLTLGQFDAAVAELRALTVAQPLRELPWRLLMLALHRCGRQAEAAAAFRRYRQVLAQEGLEPSSAIEAVHAAILAAPDTLRPPEPVLESFPGVAATAPARVPWRPPRPATSLIGREEELAVVLGLLKTHALVTLTGPAGVGKSRLAVEAAGAEAAVHLDGACIVPLAAVADASEVWHAVTEELRIAPSGAAVPGPDRLAGALAGWDLVLLLDGAEHVLDAVAALTSQLVNRCPGVIVLVTSQERLGVPGEYVVPLTPLPTDGPHSAAVRLFAERATAVNPAFQLGADELPAVTALCHHLDGLPLAVEMAAARASSYTPRDLLDRLDRRFALLHGVRAADPGRHETLRAAVDWSFRLLTPTERDVFATLAVFPAAFDAAAAAAVCHSDPEGDPEGDPETVRGILARLVDRSMVTADLRGGQARFTLLETLRAYGTDVLRGRGEYAAVRARHAAWALTLAEQADAGLRGPDEGWWIARIDAALPDLRAAHDWAVAERKATFAGRLASALFTYTYNRLILEPADWATTALQAFGSDAPPATHVLAAVGPTVRGELAAAQSLARAGLARAATGDPARHMAGLILADCAIYTGELRQVPPHSAENLHSADPYTKGLAHQTIATAHTYLGDIASARSHVAQARSEYQRSGSPTIAAWADYVAGEILAADDPTTALRHLDTAVRTARKVGNRLIEGVSLVAATACRGRRGEPGTALPAVAAAIGHWHHQGDWTHQWPTLRTAAILLSRLGDHHAAITIAAAVAASGPPAYGTEADDLAAVQASAQTALGPPAVDKTKTAGQALSPADTVLYAMQAITDRLPAT
jgi:predicted ATPase/DNA-binding SARP family transcriptional activator